MKPLISVLMPVRAPDQYLSPAINSVLQQTLDDFELLVITYADAQSWSQQLPKDHRIRFIQRDRPGIVAALNTGLEAANGEYIARMDADDIALPQRFAQQLQFLQFNPNVAIAGARVQIFNSESVLQQGNQVYQNWLNQLCSPGDIRNNLFVESPLPHPTLFAAKSVFQQLQGYSQCGWAEDYDLLLRAFLAGLPMGKPEPVLLRWRDHGERLTRTDQRYSRQNFIRAKAWALSQSLAQDRSVIICGTGRNALRLCDALQELGVEVHCFVEHDDAPKKTTRRHLPVITYRELKKQKHEALLVSAVSARGAREQLREWFAAQHWQEFRDYVIAG